MLMVAKYNEVSMAYYIGVRELLIQKYMPF